MKRGGELLAVVGPVLVALALWLPRAVPPPPAALPAPARAIELPALTALAPRRDALHELVAEQSSVRFLVEDGRGRLFASCTTITGRLELTGETTGTLELAFDLAGIELLEPATSGLSLAAVRSILGGDRVLFRAQLVATEIGALGVRRLRFVGPLEFGAVRRLQRMDLFVCQLPGRALRVLGVGTVLGADFGLLASGPFAGTAPRISLGLDLGFRRRRGS